MKKEIIINSNLRENRVALLEDKRLVELHVEHSEDERLVGGIYKGRIGNVVVSIQAAFVDIGIDVHGFLPFSDLGANALHFVDGREIYTHDAAPAKDRRGRTILKPGDDIVVQITKEPISDKGPRLTSKISLPGRFLVLIPNEDIAGISRRVENLTERRRLRSILRKLALPGYGLIARTVAEGKSEPDLKADFERLMKQWREIEASFHSAPPPLQLHRDVGMVSSLIRDLFSEDTNRVVIDNKKIYREVIRYLQEVKSRLVERVELYHSREPLFDHLEIEGDVEKITSHKVWLTGGGSLIIESTEAMVTIDVNSGSYNRKRNIEDNILRVNLAAVREICRQLRLRDLGGLIVMDFIDMADDRNRQRVQKAMEEELIHDRAQTDILPISKFGLMEMTRQRIRPALLLTLRENCEVCDGTGLVPSRETMVTELEGFVRRFRAQTRERRLQLAVHPDLHAYLIEGKRSIIKLLMWKNFMYIDLKKDESLTVGKFQAISLKQKREITQEFSS
ncbi:MAG: Rne/Rng family ribonuclease [Candidatus Delongbacteria bacterium]|nr:Rne/Rng family ribonuclease [Candidatus Delongbacteria bacterium]